MKLGALILLLPVVVLAQTPGINSAAFIGAANPVVSANAPMSFASLVTLASTTDLSSYTTSSFTPTPNALVLAFVNSTAATPGTPTLTGNGLTWVALTNSLYSQSRLTIFRAQGSSPSAGTLVADFGATQTGAIIRVVEFRNASTSGSDGSGAIAQVAALADTSTTTANPSLTMASIGGGGRNAVIAFSINGFNPYAATQEDGWTEDYDSGHALPTSGGYISYQLNSTDNTIQITRAATSWVLIGVEINAQ